MITTPRSLFVGAGAFLLAFVVVFAARIHTTDFGAYDVTVLVVSGVLGFVAVLALGNRYCRTGLERGHAVMVFALSFFAGIYAPITAIWANASFYRWAITQTVKPKRDLLSQYLAPVVEHTGSSHYAGVILIVGGAWLVARFLSREERPALGKLGWPAWPDVVFGMAVWVSGVLAMWARSKGELTVYLWLGLCSGAFLLTLLFRSLRLQWSAVRQQPPEFSVSVISRKTSIAVLTALWLGLPFISLSGGILVPYQTPIFAATVVCILPWALYHWLVENPVHLNRTASSGVCAFAVRCGFWSGIALALSLMGVVLSGIGESLLQKAAGSMSTPFALTVIVLKPLCHLFFPALIMGWVGGFFVAAVLPATTRPSVCIRAVAQGGATMCLVACVSILMFSLSVALLTVTLLPVGKTLPAEVTRYFGNGQWYRLGGFYLLALAGMFFSGGVMWGIQASMVCGIKWVFNRCRRPASTLAGPSEAD